MIDLTRFVDEISGPIEWGEALVYAGALGLQLGLGDCPEPIRLVWGTESFYRGGIGATSTGEGVIHLNESHKTDPGDNLRRHAKLRSVCGEAAHEAIHHRLGVAFTEDFESGEYEALEQKLSLHKRRIILCQLDAESIIKDAGAGLQNLSDHWTASVETILLREREEVLKQDKLPSKADLEDREQAALSSAQEFLCQLGACLAWQRIKLGPARPARILESLRKENIFPSEHFGIMETIISTAIKDDAEKIAHLQALHALDNYNSTEFLEARHEAINSEDWPDDLDRGIALTRLPVFKS